MANAQVNERESTKN